jgi:hypothetical protein
MHTTGDGLVPNENEQAYASIVDDREQLLRQTFVHRAGHCTFTPAETIAAFNALVERVQTGCWPSLSPTTLNAAATGLGAPLNPQPAAFLRFKPAQFERPFAPRL